MRIRYMVLVVGMMLVITIACSWMAFAGRTPVFKAQWLGSVPGKAKNKIVIIHYLGNHQSGDMWDRERLEKANRSIVNDLNEFLETLKNTEDVLTYGLTEIRDSNVKPWYQESGMKYSLGCGVSAKTILKTVSLSAFPTIQVYGHDGSKLCSVLAKGDVDSWSERYQKAVKEGVTALRESRVQQQQKNFKKADALVDAGKFVKAYGLYLKIVTAIEGTKKGAEAASKAEFLSQRILEAYHEDIFRVQKKSLAGLLSSMRIDMKTLRKTPLENDVKLLLSQVTTVHENKDDELLLNLKLNHVRRLQAEGSFNLALRGYETLRATATEEETKNEILTEMERIESIVVPTVRYVVQGLQAEDDRAQQQADELCDYFQGTELGSRIESWVLAKAMPGDNEDTPAHDPTSISTPAAANKVTSFKTQDEIQVPADWVFDTLVAEAKQRMESARRWIRNAEKNTSDNAIYIAAVDKAILDLRYCLAYFQRALALSPTGDSVIREHIREARKTLFWTRKFQRQ